MKNLLSTLTLLLLTSALFAQIGISGSYSTIKTPGWEDIMKNEGVFSYESGYSIGLDYWFKLKEYRVEFLPEISYAKFDNQFEGAILEPQILLSELEIFAFSFNTQVYLFDLEGDCNCPTWGKEGSFFEKGFFLMAGPGVSLVKQADFRDSLVDLPEPKEGARLMLSVGVGLDIGISKAITLTAFGRYRWHQSKNWESIEYIAFLAQTQDQYEDFDSAITQIQPGIKLSYRWGE